jgi:hypothetical protein
VNWNAARQRRPRRRSASSSAAAARLRVQRQPRSRGRSDEHRRARSSRLGCALRSSKPRRRTLERGVRLEDPLEERRHLVERQFSGSPKFTASPALFT